MAKNCDKNQRREGYKLTVNDFHSMKRKKQFLDVSVGGCSRTDVMLGFSRRFSFTSTSTEEKKFTSGLSVATEAVPVKPVIMTDQTFPLKPWVLLFFFQHVKDWEKERVLGPNGCCHAHP